jgi:hypothetical protein
LDLRFLVEFLDLFEKAYARHLLTESYCKINGYL